MAVMFNRYSCWRKYYGYVTSNHGTIKWQYELNEQFAYKRGVAGPNNMVPRSVLKK